MGKPAIEVQEKLTDYQKDRMERNRITALEIKRTKVINFFRLVKAHY